MKTYFDYLNEEFDWEDFMDTDLSGPGWEMRCEELIEEFVKDLNKELKKGTAPDSERKGALKALEILFKQQIEEAKKNL